MSAPLGPGHRWSESGRCALCGALSHWPGARKRCPIAVMGADVAAATADRSHEGTEARKARARAHVEMRARKVGAA